MKTKTIEPALETLLARLGQQFHGYLVQNELELLVSLQQEGKVSAYIQTRLDSISEQAEQLLEENRPAYVIEALMLEDLTRDLRPSRFSYIRGLLEEEFEEEFERMRQYGILTYEVINLAGACEPIFEIFRFCEENEDDKELRYAVTGMIAEYVGR